MAIIERSRGIFWGKNEVPFPKGSYLNRNTGDVFVYLDDGPRRSSRRAVIGRAASESTLYPNRNYRRYLPGEWSKNFGEEVDDCYEMHPGLYAAALGIGYSTGLYPLLCETLGPESANAVMDYSMYSILWKSDVSMCFKERMAGEVLFSRLRFDEAWLSSLFSRRLDEPSRARFRSAWLDRCRERGLNRAWICIDGSNIDCAAKVSKAGRGHANSLKDTDILGYIYAVAQDGTPLAFSVNHGSVVDCKALAEIVALLSLHGIECEGIVLDRGFCTAEDLRLLRDAGYDYVMMLRSDTAGHRKMYGEHGSGLMWDVERLAADVPLFGIGGSGAVVGGYPHEAFLCLYVHGITGAERKAAAVSRVAGARESMQTVADSGGKPDVPQGLGKYLSVKWNGHRWTVETDTAAWKKAVDAAGFFTIASSRDLGPARTYEVYRYRDISEKTYAAIKTGMGYDAIRVHSDESVEGKFFVCFIGSVIRNEFERACLRNKMQTSLMAAELDRIKMIRGVGDDFTFVRNISDRQRTLLAEWDIEPDDFKGIVSDYNSRTQSKIVSQNRRKPEHEKAADGRRKPGRRAKGHEDSQPAGVAEPKRGRGRPKGSGKPAEPKQAKPDTGRHPGRPKGSKNKATIEKEARMAALGIMPSKRQVGRPLGSKDSKPRKKPRRDRVKQNS